MLTRGIGSQCYSVSQTLPSLKQTELHLYAAHQDQVIALPPDASVFLTSVHCEFAGLTYGLPVRAISIQAHPEFTKDYEQFVIEKTPLSDKMKACALRSLDIIHNDSLTGWILAFILTAHRASC